MCSPTCILTSPTSTSLPSELGWATGTPAGLGSEERFMMSKPQHQQAAAMVVMSDIKTNAQQQFST